MSQPAPPPPSSRIQDEDDSHSMTSIFRCRHHKRNHPQAPPLSAFLDCDKALASAVNLAHVHQIKQRRIESLEQELFDLEGRWREICGELATGNKELQEIIEEGEERIKAMEEAKKAAIPYPELLAYAQSLSAFSSAPPNMPDLSLPGQPPPPLFFPPFPNEEKMRRGRLNAEAPLGNLGETHSVAPAPIPSPVSEKASHAPGHNPYMHEFRAPPPSGGLLDFDLDLNPDL
ncbi:vitamin-D-receptor interacting mediator subunit 4-domain-containing protein [Ephemerocybe angulata]|uniref:Mediator of RNA polymerase II transcription subunit 4 n=1 Tax=Ephemerocybe angulata TaxID=980116 RepID=A0A8H6IC48_9AGAR|nr:vitamin-D-receptor interacting mediator subunit 4-domain-containing protein [Tulosesus angulatus]